MISFDRQICNDLDAATSREWLETNGIGGFSCGTISGVNTRRYHGLLTAAVSPPLGRIRLLSKFDEAVEIGGRSYDLSANKYQGTGSPEGYLHLKGFRLDPYPIWTYEVAGLEIEKRLVMAHRSNTVGLSWKIKGRSRVRASLVIKPLAAFVDYHSLCREDESAVFGYEIADGQVTLVRQGFGTAMHLHHNGAGVEQTGFWYRNFDYDIERERGFDWSEDLFQPFILRFDLSTEPATVVATTENSLVLNFDAIAATERKRRRALIKKADVKTDLEKQLVLAADQFIVARGSGQTVIAGYPWFSDWGRDTMIALNGLTLATGRPEVARGILLEFSRHVSEGMLPNRFPDVGDNAEYNTVDATLWYFEAIRAYVAATGDTAFVRRHLYLNLADIVAWHLHGTRYNIHLDTDGLLYAGTPDVQLTWMDAKMGDRVFTPRAGKAVEIQALWFNALMIMAALAKEFGDTEDEARYQAMAELCSLSFNGAFWNEEEQCLFDVVDDGTRDPSIRPNQIFAVSLPHSMLDNEHASKVVARVEKDLLTPFGLRSLSPSDQKYRNIYVGSPFDRDSAYHQGPVWAWLIGPFVDAYQRVHGTSKAAEQRIAEILSAFKAHLYEAGVGQISEIFDPEDPYKPRGCFAQAWSVAEVLRVSRSRDPRPVKER